MHHSWQHMYSFTGILLCTIFSNILYFSQTRGSALTHADRNSSYLPKSPNKCPTTSKNAVPPHTLRESQNKAMTQFHTSCFSVMQYFLELRNPCAVKSFKSALNISRYIIINTYCALRLKTTNTPATLLSSFNTTFRCSRTCSLK